jgi:hypothetical protein
MLTSNHIHLLVKDTGQDGDQIPQFAGQVIDRSGKSYGPGQMWQDLAHAADFGGVAVKKN